MVVDKDGELKERRLPLGVRTVLAELGLAAVRDKEHLPILITTRALARRTGHDDVAGRATRRGLQEAERLGLIRRGSPVGQFGAHAALPTLLHPAWLAAGGAKKPWDGGSILVPRDWDEVDPDQPPKRLVTWPVKTTGPVKKAGRKGSEERDHYPPGPGPPPLLAPAGVVPASAADHGRLRERSRRSRVGPHPAGPVIPSGASARGGSDDDELLEVDNMNQDMDRDMVSSAAARARSLAALAGFGSRRAAGLAVPAVEVAVDDRYWTWLATSAAAAGWADKQVAAWAGSAGGDLEFVLQRRGRRSGQRAGTFMEERVALSAAASGAVAVLARARTARGLIEPAFRPLGEHPLLLIDDLKPADLTLFDGWRGVAIVETSPGNLQASFMAPRVLLTREVLAAQRELSSRCGLTMASVEPNKLRRFTGSTNYKSGLPEPFVTRLFREPIDGTISDEQLADLLAAHVAEVAAAMAGGIVTTAAAASVSKPALAAGEPASVKKRGRVGGGIGGGTDDSGSGQDWAWLMTTTSRVGGRDRDRLVAELVVLCEARERQGKAGTDADHMRYAEYTVDKALKHRAALQSKRMP